jgi:hypothetical protein
VQRAWRPDRKRACVRFRFHSTAEFHHFRYRIGTEGGVRGRTITIRLRGLSTTGLQMPEPGRAEGVVDLFDLAGTYDVRVIAQGNAEATFRLDVQPAAVSLADPVGSAPAFLDVHTA